LANSSKYPNSIDTTNDLPLATNNVTAVVADQVNRLRNAIINIETELGVNPSGTYSTVRDRLDAQNGTVGTGAVQIQNDGTVVVNEATIIDFIGNVTVTNPSSLKARIEVTGGQATQVQETKTVSTNGQTSFTLTSTPVDGTSVLMFVNGLKQTYSSDFLISGTSVSYVGTTSLTTSDIVEFYYLVDLGGISGGSGSNTITLKEDATTVSSSVTTVNFTGNVNLTDNGAGQVTVDIPTATPTITLKEDATTVSSSVTTINFTGNTNLTNNGGGQITVDIPTVTPTITLKEEGTNVNTATTTVNFTGNVNLTNNGSGQVTVDIPSGGGGSSAKMRVYVNSDITNTTDALAVPITWNGTSTLITAANCTLADSNTQIQVAVAGTYLIQGQFSYEGDPSTGVPQQIYLSFLKNGSTELSTVGGSVSNILGIDGETIFFCSNFIAQLAINDTIEVTSVFSGVGAGTILHAGETTSWFSVTLLN
jgi:hypothetical protein